MLDPKTIILSVDGTPVGRVQHIELTILSGNPVVNVTWQYLDPKTGHLIKSYGTVKRIYEGKVENAFDATLNPAGQVVPLHLEVKKLC